jgi:hypothetical protein
VRRAVVVAAGVLVVALSAAVAPAAAIPQAANHNEIAAQLMLRLFGETSDSSASFAAAHGDRSSESPLRELALQVRTGGASDLASGVGEAFGDDRIALRNLDATGASGISIAAPYVVAPSAVHFALPTAALGSAVAIVPPSGHFTVAYQPVPPQPAISPAPGTMAFSLPQMHVSDFVPSAAQIGAVQFEAHAAGDPSETPQLALHDTTYGAGADFDVRAGKRNVNLNLSSEFEQAGPNNYNSFSVSPLGSASSWQPPAANAPLFLPSSTDLNRLSLGAGVSVPVSRGLTLNLNYGAQRLFGAYGPMGLVNLDTMSNTYGGKLTFSIPQISSSLSIGAYQDRYQDSILPVAGQTQTREDVNFTVKF